MSSDLLRSNWRRFDEYFQVLASSAQIGFEMARYLIMSQNAIHRILEFVMNSFPPFTSNKIRMRDHQQEANFTQAVDVLSILVRSCFTQGIKRVQQYSPESKYQNEDQHILLPYDNHYNKFPLLTADCFTYELIIKANPNNDSLERMVVHLCWGDPETSSFFIGEIMSAIKCRRYTDELAYHFKILSKLMNLNDDFQQERLKEVFNFEADDETSSFASAVITTSI